MSANPRVLPEGYIDPWTTIDPVMPRGPARGDFSVGGSAPGSFTPGAVLPPAGPGLTPVYEYQRYALINGSKIFTVGTSSVVSLLDKSTSWRNFLHLRNASGSGGANIFVNFGALAVADSAGVAGSGFRLAPDEQILFDASVPQDDMYAIADAAGGLLVVSFSVMALPGP